MGKILLALRYGSMKTKITLITIALLLTGGGALLVYGIIKRSLPLMGSGALALIAGLLFMFSISFAEHEKKQEEEKRKLEDSDEMNGYIKNVLDRLDGPTNGVNSTAATAKESEDNRVQRVSIEGVETVIKEPGSGIQEGVPIARENAGYVPEWQNDMIITEYVEKGTVGSTVGVAGNVPETGERGARGAFSSSGTAGAGSKDFSNATEAGAVGETAPGIANKSAAVKKAAGIRDRGYSAAENVELSEEENTEFIKKLNRVTRYENEAAALKQSQRRNVPLTEDEDDQRETTVQPDRKLIKERKKLLRVKGGDKKNTPILIDEWDRQQVEKTPAYVQVKGKTVSIVLVERTLRTITMPLDRFKKVTYARNVEERHMENYDALREDKEVFGIFEELLPNFSFASNRFGNTSQFRNQYILGGEIAVTPRSIRKLLSKFELEFKVFDSLDIRGSYSDYFKRAYENRIFWTDNCITQIEYQNRIRGLLQSMVEDDEVMRYEFGDELNLMIKYKLITREYADFYIARKEERERSRATR